MGAASSMEPVFPLGVKKDLDGALPRRSPAPSFDAERRWRRSAPPPRSRPRFAKGSRRTSTRTTSALKLAGAGGDGAQTAAMLITRAAIDEGFDATHIPSYGPESRGGTSYADVHVADDRGARRRPRRTRTCWSRSTRRAWPSSARRCAPAARSSTTARSSLTPPPLPPTGCA